MLLDITSHDQKTVISLLKAFLPGTTIWAFGSRMKFTSKPESDLDLVAFITPEQEGQLAELKEAFAESDLPFKVDILNWDVIPDNFKQNIEKDYVVFKVLEERKQQLPPNWKPYKLGEFTSINPKITLKQGEEYSFVEMKDLDPQFKYVSPSAIKNFKSGSKFNNGDTLFARITPCLENGKISQVKNLENGVGFGSTEFIVFRGNDHLSDNDFVYYLTRSDEIRNKAIQAMTGTSGRQRVEKSALAEIEIIAPCFPAQQLISSILSALDNKIELNQQMNQTLETMAQAIFKEWFVNFNFPGFDGELVDGLPKGWKRGKIEDLFVLQRGFDLPGTARTVGRYPVVASNGVATYHNEFKLLGPGITTGRSGVLGKVFYINQPFWPLNTSLFVKEFKIASPLYAYYVLLGLNLIQLNGGSAVPTLNRNDVHGIDCIIPQIKLIEDFEKVVNVFFEKKLKNEFQIESLIEIRDSLLPRLMTGKIEVNS